MYQFITSEIQSSSEDTGNIVAITLAHATKYRIHGNGRIPEQCAETCLTQNVLREFNKTTP